MRITIFKEIFLDNQVKFIWYRAAYPAETAFGIYLMPYKVVTEKEHWAILAADYD